MADDVTLNAPTIPGGKEVRTDEVGGKQYQVIKIALGGDNEDNGWVGPNRMPVIAADLPLPAGAATEVTLAEVEADLDAIYARLNDGSQRSVVRGGAKGATTAADVTSTSIDADRQALDVAVKASALPVGAATEAKQDVEIAQLNDMEADLEAIYARQADGVQKSIVRGGAKGSTVAADVTSTSISSQTQALDVAVQTSALPAGAATETTLAKVADATGLESAATGSRPTRAAQVDVDPIGPAGRLTIRYDVGVATIYKGWAPNGTAASATGWTISRTTLVAGNPTITEWTAHGAASWDNRASASYS